MDEPLLGEEIEIYIALKENRAGEIAQYNLVFPGSQGLFKRQVAYWRWCERIDKIDRRGVDPQFLIAVIFLELILHRKGAIDVLYGQRIVGIGMGQGSHVNEIDRVDVSLDGKLSIRDFTVIVSQPGYIREHKGP